jgi:hypothetical protein
MTISNGYASLAELREKLSLTAANTAANTQLERLIETGSRTAENICGRRFYAVAQTRYYTADDGYEIEIDDLTGTPTIKTDDDGDGVYETTWAATDYNLKYGNDYNAALDGKPYTNIEVSGRGTNAFPVGVKKAVLVYGNYGYSSGTNAATARPQPIADAVLLAAERVYKRKDAPLGVAGSPALGQQMIRVPDMQNDPDIMTLLQFYIRRR